MTGEIHVDIDQAVATLTIDNREKRNALGPPLIAEIIDAFNDREDREDVRCVVLTERLLVRHQTVVSQVGCDQ